MFNRLAMLAVAGAAAVTALGAAHQPQPRLTATCHYKAGPLRGQTIDYSGVPGVVSVPVGNRCADMQGSRGVAVAEGEARESSQGRYYSSPGAPLAWNRSGELRAGFGQSCRFYSGPRSGTTLDYSHTLGAAPLPIGADCADGANRGLIVGPGPGPGPGPGSGSGPGPGPGQSPGQGPGL
jgi:hypothetical protein